MAGAASSIAVNNFHKLSTPDIAYSLGLTVSANEFTAELERRFREAFPPQRWSGCRVVVAVSGGSDSVALLYLLVRSAGSREQLVVGHVNHKLRGADSDLDASFVAELCETLGVRACIRVAPPLTERHNGLEEAARRFRYTCLREIAENAGARFVLTAHTADDQAETILYRLFRGTGLHGLRGIPRSRPFGPTALVRPLLSFKRQELVHYLDVLGAAYRRDATNEALTFARNRIRHLVIPAALQVHPAAVDGVLRLGETARETYDFIHRQIELALEKCVISRGQGLAILDRRELSRIDNFLLQGILIELWRLQKWPMRKLTRDHILTLRQLILSSSTQERRVTFHLPGCIEFIMHEHQVSFRSLKEANQTPHSG